MNLVNKGIKGIVNETPKKGDPIFNKVQNFLVGNNCLACSRAVICLRRKGLPTINLGSYFNGESRNFGALLSKLTYDFVRVSKSFAFVLGGETTVKIKNASKSARGGRNQEEN